MSTNDNPQRIPTIDKWENETADLANRYLGHWPGSGKAMNDVYLRCSGMRTDGNHLTHCRCGVRVAPEWQPHHVAMAVAEAMVKAGHSLPENVMLARSSGGLTEELYLEVEVDGGYALQFKQIVGEGWIDAEPIRFKEKPLPIGALPGEPVTEPADLTVDEEDEDEGPVIEALDTSKRLPPVFEYNVDIPDGALWDLDALKAAAERELTGWAGDKTWLDADIVTVDGFKARELAARARAEANDLERTVPPVSEQVLERARRLFRLDTGSPLARQEVGPAPEVQEVVRNVLEEREAARTVDELDVALARATENVEGVDSISLSVAIKRHLALSSIEMGGWIRRLEQDNDERGVIRALRSWARAESWKLWAEERGIVSENPGRQSQVRIDEAVAAHKPVTGDRPTDFAVVCSCGRQSAVSGWSAWAVHLAMSCLESLDTIPPPPEPEPYRLTLNELDAIRRLERHAETELVPPAYKVTDVVSVGDLIDELQGLDPRLLVYVDEYDEEWRHFSEVAVRSLSVVERAGTHRIVITTYLEDDER